MRDYLKRIHLAGVVGVATTLVGILGDPAVIGFLPHHIATLVTIAGAVIQATTRAVNKGNVVEVPK